MKFIDTHCHIHDSEFADRFGMSTDELVEDSVASGLEKLICVGTDVKSSLEAVKTADRHEICAASIALHPHEAESKSIEQLETEVQKLVEMADKLSENLVAIGETGLDYFYHESTEVISRQKAVFRMHIELALQLDLPLIFHVREAFDDFFEIIDDYEGIKGVVHSFSATKVELEGVIDRGLYVGLNGIMTFTGDQKQIEASKAVPLEKLLIETDAPFLTPKPLRGKINTPKNVILITQHLSEVRGEEEKRLVDQTTKNAKELFNL